MGVQKRITYLRCEIGSQFVNHACELAPCTFYIEDERLTAEFAVENFFFVSPDGRSNGKGKVE